VVGPLAASAIIFALILFAFFSVITPSKAAGTKTSHSISNKSLLEMNSAFGKPLTVLVLVL